MKKSFIILALGCLGLGSGSTLVAGVAAKPAPSKELALGGIPLNDIAQILKDVDQVTDIFGQIGLSDVQRKLQPVADSIKQAGGVLGGMQNFSDDLQGAQKAFVAFPLIVKCTNNKKAKVGGKEVCQLVGCAGSRKECLKSALIQMQKVLKPLIVDMFIEHKDAKGNVQKPLVQGVLEVAQQKDAIKQLEPIVNVMQIIMNILGIIENVLSVGEQKADSTAKPVAGSAAASAPTAPAAS